MNGKYKMHVLVLPVSGEAFSVQLGLMIEMTSAFNYRPDLTLAASGGNAVAYTAFGADWSPHGIKRIASSLSSEMFVSSWMPPELSFLPSWLLGVFYGSLYQRGVGVSQFFHSYFTPSTIIRDEIWTGTVNQDTWQARFFCNLSKKDSVINDNLLMKENLVCMPPCFLNGDIGRIALVSEASASIPGVVDQKLIDGDNYGDGGLLFASPLTGMREAVNELEGVKGEGLHIDYLNGNDISTAPPIDDFINLFDVGNLALHQIVNGLRIQDRLSGIDLVRIAGGPLIYEQGECSIEKLQWLREDRKKYRRSMVELYPSLDVKTVPLVSFTGKDVIASIENTREKYYYRYWHSP